MLAVLALTLAAPARAGTAPPVPSGSYTIVSDFGSSSSDGFVPQGGLMRARDGTLWGTTEVGGNSNYPDCFISCGTVYRLVPNASGYQRQAIYEFSGPDGANPFGQLVQTADGKIYGTTSQGGANGTGEIFAILPGTLSVQVAYSFPAFVGPANQTGGVSPYTGVVVSGSTLFGTTIGGGGRIPLGTVYAFNELTQTATTVHWFNAVSAANPAGEGSESTLLAGNDGRLYGTTVYGGASGYGEIFAMNPDGSNFSILHTFSGMDGNSPRGHLVLFDGWIYGVTGGGAGTGGTIFRISPDSSQFQVVYSFAKETNPVSLTPVAGFLFGTTFMGGRSGQGMVFRTGRAGGIRLWHSFLGGPNDGDAPSLESPLIDLGNGYLAGTTSGGGSYSPPQSTLEYGFSCGTTVACYYVTVRGGGTAFEIATSAPSPEVPLVRNRTQPRPWQAGHPAHITILNAR